MLGYKLSSPNTALSHFLLEQVLSDQSTSFRSIRVNTKLQTIRGTVDLAVEGRCGTREHG